MAGLRFVPILVSLQILTPHAAPTDPPPPPAPTIALSPLKELYWIGDDVTVICSAPPQRLRVDGCRITASGGRAVMVREKNRKCRHTFTIRGVEDGGGFSCAYTIMDRQRRWVTSVESPKVGIRVQPPPPAPSLHSDPSPPITNQGSPLLLLCSAPPSNATPPSRRFVFYRDGEPGDGDGLHSDPGPARFWLQETELNHSGVYECAYEEQVGQRWIRSDLSAALRVEVKALPIRPTLLLDPPSGVLWDGQGVTLTCEANGSVAGRRFSFYRDGEPLLVDGSDGDASRYRVDAGGGNFSCSYQEEVGGTWVTSPHSARREVVTQGRFPSIALGCGAAGAAVLLLVSIGLIYYCKRRRGGVNWKGLGEKDEAGALPMVGMEA